MRPLLTNRYTATAAVAGNRIVKHGAADGTAVQATAAGEAFLGVSDRMGADAGGDLDVHEVGEADVTYGGNVARGDPLTSDAQGRAVAAAPAAGANVSIIGFARVAGVLGDIAPVTLNRGRIQG